MLFVTKSFSKINSNIAKFKVKKNLKKLFLYKRFFSVKKKLCLFKFDVKKRLVLRNFYIFSYFNKFARLRFFKSLLRLSKFNKCFYSLSIRFLFLFEFKLNVFLFRLKIFKTFFEAVIVITKGWVFVNGFCIIKPDFFLKVGDAIQVSCYFYFTFKSRLCSNWRSFKKNVKKFSKRKLRKQKKVFIEFSYKTLVFFIYKFPKIAFFVLFKLFQKKKIDYLYNSFLLGF